MSVGRRLRTAAWSAVVLVVVALLVTAIVAVRSGNWTVTPVLSGSMQPGFPVGGVAVARAVPVHDLKVRDVIRFQNPNRPADAVVHRITSLKFDASGRAVVKTQGDANDAPDPWTVTLSGTRVYLVEFTVPLLGYAAVAANRGVFLIIGGTVILAATVATVLAQRRRRPTVTRSSTPASAPAGPVQ